MELTSTVKEIFASEKSGLEVSMDPSKELNLPSTSETTRWDTEKITLLCVLSNFQTVGSKGRENLFTGWTTAVLVVFEKGLKAKIASIIKGTKAIFFMVLIFK